MEKGSSCGPVETEERSYGKEKLTDLFTLHSQQVVYRCMVMVYMGPTFEEQLIPDQARFQSGCSTCGQHLNLI